MEHDRVLSGVTARIAGVATESVVDGPGLRSTVFFQGCPHQCPGCHNPGTWDPGGGLEIALLELIELLKLNPLISGVTFSGGEPFMQAPAAAALADYLKAKGLNLWIYTGYTWEELLKSLDAPGYKELLHFADVVVDGPFLQEGRDSALIFRGSSNQRVILVSESYQAGTIITWEPQRVQIR
jgi:anaerobic ribonucleoside-triphosphate reductase activating protein